MLEFTELDSLLLNDHFYTVFAPNNAAFESQYDADAIDSLKLNDPEYLELLLLNHFVADTVDVKFVSDQYLPLSGSHFSLFVDGAGNVLLYSYGTPNSEPTVYLYGQYIIRLNKLRTLKMGDCLSWIANIIRPNCRPSSDWQFVTYGPLPSIIAQSVLLDSIEQSDRPLTFLCPGSNDLFDYINENGGFSNTSLIDSIVRRHIIEGYLPLQGIKDGMTVENMLGEELHFSLVDDQFVINGNAVIRTFYDFKKSATFGMEGYLEEVVLSSVSNVDNEGPVLFPNPTRDKLTVEFKNNKISLLKIISIQGELLKLEEQLGSKAEIDVSLLDPGVYILECQIGSETQRKQFSVF